MQLSMDVVCGLIVCYQLAAAEAKAESLRRELAGRRGDKNVDLSKLKPPILEQRIDGIGYREAIFSSTTNVKRCTLVLGLVPLLTLLGLK